MKITAKLNISTGFSIVMVLVIGLIVYLSYAEMDRVSHQEKTIQKIVNGVFELNNLANEYVLFHRERTWEQWYIRYDSLSELIQIEGFYTIEEKLLLKEMQQNHERSKSIFYRLVTDYESKEKSGQVIADATELEKRLIGHLFSSSLIMTSNAEQLIVINHKKLESAQKNISLALIFLISIAVMVIITSMFFIRRSIIKPIARLYEGSAIIGSGNLNYKVGIKAKDEIGKLSEAFNRMTDNLNVVTVSRDELSEEIKHRKQIEVELEKIIKKLKKALAKVKTLSGFIPICSHCKKIRDDKGYWTQVEEYVRDHTEAEFSHSLCPDCIKKYYPEYYNKLVLNEKNKRAK